MQVTWDQLVKRCGEPKRIDDWKNRSHFEKLIKERRLVTEHCEGESWYYKIGWGWVNRIDYWEFPVPIPEEITEVENEEFNNA